MVVDFVAFDHRLKPLQLIGSAAILLAAAGMTLAGPCGAGSKRSEMQSGVLRMRSGGKRIYADDIKAERVRQCLVPGTSVAAAAMAHRINANLLRR